MYIILFIAIVAIVYIKSFKDNFTQETIDKVAPILLIIAGITLVFMLLISVLSH